MYETHKYETPMADYFSLELPKDAKISEFQIQQDKLHIWATVNPEKEKEKRIFQLSETRDSTKESLEKLDHIGTTKLSEGSFYLHLFEIKQ